MSSSQQYHQVVVADGGRRVAGGKISEMEKWREGKQKWKMAGTKVAGIGGKEKAGKGRPTIDT